MLLGKRSVAIVLLAMSWPALASVPVTFQAGTAAKASEVNQNFSNLDTRLNASLGGLIVSSVASSATSVASASCPSDRIVLSANCDCDYVNGTRNFGVLFGCQVSGNGGVAGCFSESGTYNPYLPEPLATVHVRCLSGVTNDGTPLTPVIVPLSTPLPSSKLGGDRNGTVNTDAKATTDALEEAVKSLQDRALDHEARLKSGLK